jgi:hypothetical protein
VLNSLDEIKAANRVGNGDQHWFSPDTMKWFHSRVSEKVWPVNDGAYFVTSERPSPSPIDGHHEPRRYTVRFCSDAGDIDTVGDFRAHDTMREAAMHARAAADVHHMPKPADD